MTSFRFEFHPYRRKFKRPLQTKHGNWQFRQGIILRLSDNCERIAFGEIAPISWFGSETFEQALAFCRQLPSEIDEEIIFSIPNEFPACQFGFESAWETLISNSQIPQSPQLPLSYLLPAKEAALQEWQPLWNQGYRTFKWKIGIAPIKEELQIFHQLVKSLPATAKLRLDANGGLNYIQAEKWLQVCDEIGGIVEFLEQPLAVEALEAMLELSTRFSTPIALDESVATLSQMQNCYQRGWRGIFVIKPSIVGSPRRLREFCQSRQIDAVFSSAFETAIGRQAALNLAAELSRHNRAVGFGVSQWFEDEDESWIQELCQIY